MRIMAFGAHPDDMELCCAGTLAKYKAAGAEVAMVVVTNGEVGSATLPKDKIAAVRQSEARNSAAVIGAEFFWLGYPDEFLFNTPEARLNIIDTIRRFGPDIILAPDKDVDYHPDHTTTGQLIWDTHVMVTVPNIETPTAPARKIPEIYFMDTTAGVNFVPELYIDISEHIDTKIAMLNCHESQDAWMMDQYNVHLAEHFESQWRFRGLQSGCAAAEAFRKPRFFPQTPTSSGLLPMVKKEVFST